MNWQLQKAKNRLSELVKAAEKKGPQVITVHGKERAVVVSAEEYRRLVRRKGSLLEFFQKSPWASAEIDISRSRDLGRQIEL